MVYNYLTIVFFQFRIRLKILVYKIFLSTYSGIMLEIRSIAVFNTKNPIVGIDPCIFGICIDYDVEGGLDQFEKQTS
jgi:hypothetical protein